MYRLRLLPVFLSCIVLALIISCGASPSTTGGSGSTAGNAQDNGVVQFQFAGADWVSGPPGHPEMNFEEEAITDGASLVRIEAYAADGSHLALTIFNDTGVGVGTFPITDPGMRGFLQFKEEGGISYLTNGMPDNPGSITITELTSEKVVGTFNFRMRSAGDPEDIKEATAGSFDVQFTTY
ncbi:MAG: hypothetical protein AAFY48_18735 [Bacteroidota bacterium]